MLEKAIIMSMLFFYPGAMVDILYKKFVTSKHRELAVTESSKAAVAFFYSIAITIITISLYGWVFNYDIQSFENIFTIVETFNGLLGYFLLSLLSTGGFAWAWWQIQEWVIYCQAKKLYGELGVRTDSYKDVWSQICEGSVHSDVIKDTVIRIYDGDKVMSGQALVLPSKIKNGFVLQNTKTVSEIFGDDPDYFGMPVFMYYDSETGIRVEFYDGKEFAQYVRDYNDGKLLTSSSEDEEPVFVDQSA